MESLKTKMPYVSALLVTRNEKQFVEQALLSLVEQTYPKTQYEIIIIDGLSDDGTRDVINNIINKYSTEDFRIQLINNDKKILSSGWNLGIRAASGEYVVRIDAHAKASPNFIEKNIETALDHPDVICVGGKLITEAAEGSNSIVSKVLSSPFGVGNSSFRVSDTAGYVDTAVYGLYKKEIFNEVGYFNEGYVRNQDIEFHSRVKEIGGKFYFNPEIVSTYYARDTVGKMVRQAYGNGKWNMVLLKENKSALSVRHLVPFFFVLFLLSSTIAGLGNRKIWVFEKGILALHIFLGIVFAVKKTKNVFEIVQMPFLFLMLHISYGIGYFAGIKVRKRDEVK